jgi:hypothetical protein
MAIAEPVATLDPRFSSAGVAPTAWAAGRALLEQAELYWLTTVRPDGRLHVTPLVAVWLADALYFCTGADEQKAKNLARNAHCAITTGCNTLNGLDIVLEGDARRVSDETTLQRLAAAYAAKYGPPFQFTARDGGLFNGEGLAVLYEVTPTRAFGFSKGDTFSQTRWRF